MKTIKVHKDNYKRWINEKTYMHDNITEKKKWDFINITIENV